ncbi:hypothetical protein BY996DRAFT_6695652 [Phakopsora pachyrhizi]|uniref:Expressed protein n=1 Tax=Phakopsora pachyrhizi TaxID=170000 RepID=A0AAV0ARZ4_PHAPC|nr:hypothetical protein BY996DRAFT_6695652 [Phakopsora pachyrhizi]CAH7672163.1 expressed protein [Phakopsora pachyrhizi]
MSKLLRLTNQIRSSSSSSSSATSNLLRSLTNLPHHHHPRWQSTSKTSDQPGVESLESFVSDLQLSTTTAQPSQALSTQTTSTQPTKRVIPASPEWALLPHPELYDPPVLKPTHRIHVATLIIEAFNPDKDHLPWICGFSLQAAYHLGIPCSRPASVPIKTELHTVLRSGFVHKKSQENFWRLTHRRVIKAYDSNQEVINRWLSYLQKEATRGTNVALRSQKFYYRPVGWGKERLDELIGEESRLASTENVGSSPPVGRRERRKSSLTKDKGNSSSASETDEKDYSEKIKNLASELIEKELRPRAEEHEKNLDQTKIRSGKSMNEP